MPRIPASSFRSKTPETQNTLISVRNQLVKSFPKMLLMGKQLTQFLELYFQNTASIFVLFGISGGNRLITGVRYTDASFEAGRTQQVRVCLRTHGAEEDAGVGSREDGLETDAVATAFSKILSSLVGDSLGHRHGADPSGLEGGRELPPLFGSAGNTTTGI